MPNISASHQSVFDHIKAEALFEALPEATLVCDLKASILASNSRAEMLFGYGNGELVGKSMELFLPLASRDLLNQHNASLDHQTLSETRIYNSRDSIALRKDGSTLTVETSIVPFSCFCGEGFFLATVKRQKKDQQERVNSSVIHRDSRVKELNHQIKNTLQTIFSLINLQLKSVKDSAVKEAICDMRGRVHAIISVYQQLDSMDDSLNISFRDYLDTVVSGIRRETEPLISVSLQIQDIFIEIDVMISCGIIVNEAVSNSVKHAFQGRQEGEIIVSFERLLSGQNKLTISDNGIGISDPIASLESRSMGLRLIKGLALEIGGQVSWSVSGGTKVSVIWPV